MATGFPYFHSDSEAERQALQKHRIWFQILGALLIVAGMLAIAFPVVATLTTVTLIGIVLIGGAALEIVSAFWASRWGGFFLHFAGGLLYLFVGILLLDRPALGAAGYTLLLAMFFVASGIFRIVAALGQRFSGWGWTVVSGVIALFLGIMIWRDLPEAALWVIGTFVGIDLLFSGFSWVMLGIAMGNLPRDESRERGTLA
jgi:uncharacterized membrane protein HdeD (DUF308 family)